MKMQRRRFLSLVSAACVSSALPAQAYRWEGVALGARTQIILDHPQAARIVDSATAEIRRLEGIFSLYLPGSELTRLNAEGTIQAPSFELLDCLALARRIHRVTGGRFDPTVQPLWRVLATAAGRQEPPDAAAVQAARATIGYHKVGFDSSGIWLGPGQALTLNGIAQGYIADRVAGLLAGEGIRDVLIDTGEILALGDHAGEAGWPVTIANGGGRRVLSGRAIATSATNGVRIGEDQGHILDPRGAAPTGRPGVRQVSISAPSAGLADGLSTGLSLTASRDEAESLLGDLPDCLIEDYATLADG